MAKTAEKPTEKPWKPEAAADKMAFEVYHPILLMESSNKNFKWGTQFVGINEYKGWIPREETVLVAESIMQVFRDANRSTSYVDADGETQSSRRDDMVTMSQGAPVSAEQAHQKRLEGTMRVFPERISPDALEHIKEKGFETPWL